MQITYISNFQEQAKLKETDVKAVQGISLNPSFLFIDTKACYFISLKRMNWLGKDSDVTFGCDQRNDEFFTVTIHPLREDQRECPIKSGKCLPL